MEVGCWSIQGLWLNETSWHGQCSTKETPHTIESHEGCSKQLGMCMLKGCRPLAHIYTFSGGLIQMTFGLLHASYSCPNGKL